eukprot:scaffold4343_cov144-Cylindrotheca_fusiformis.AAC.15
MAGNGSSYQKGDYVAVPVDQDGNTASSGGSKKKWIVTSIVVIVLALLAVWVFHKTPGAATDEAVEKANLPKTKTGEIMLFDDNRKSMLAAHRKYLHRSRN